MERSILDVFVTCDKVLPFVTRMNIDEKREQALTNVISIKNVGRVIESDHNIEKLEINLTYSDVKPERTHIFNFKNKESQQIFKDLTSDTNEFSTCFEGKGKIEEEAGKWRKVLEKFFHRAFKKIRITNKVKIKKTEINDLMNRRSQLKKKGEIEEKDEEEIF